MDNFISYAIALFKVAKTTQQKELFYQQTKTIDYINNTYPDFFKIISCPAINKKKRKELAQHIFESLNIDKNLIFWIWVIIDNNHYHHFATIKQQCTLVHHTIFNITKIDIIAAFELNASQIKKITNFFISKINSKIDLNIQINKKLIGGLEIKINNKIYNNTFLSKLSDLKKQLLI